jgi:hypothetical protein
MRSGDPTINRDGEYSRSKFAEIVDKAFTHLCFHVYPAIVSKVPVNGHRMWSPYYGGDYDKGKFDVVEGMWDHEHCSICWFKIKEGHSYWSNEKRVCLLCDECYDFFVKQQKSPI